MKLYIFRILLQRIALLIDISELKWTIEIRSALFYNIKYGSHEPREREQGKKEQKQGILGTRKLEFGVWSLELRIDHCELIIANYEL
jgi:hypothetical protein